MPFLSPEKLLVVLVVAVIVLGPDKLPRATRQLSSTWRGLRALRTRLEQEARSVFPEMPALDSVSRVVRSPLSYLDHLADDEHVPNAGVKPSANSQAANVLGESLGESAAKAELVDDPALN